MRDDSLHVHDPPDDPQRFPLPRRRPAGSPKPTLELVNRLRDAA